MCGVFGFFGSEWDERHLREGAGELAHRGPDDGGIWDGRPEGAPVGLAHRRLSIIDLSAAGRQPMKNEDGRLVLTFNGEIYNHRALRRRLEERGHVFASRTDSEVVLHLFEDEGIAGMKALEGMFAIALWDARNRTLVLARDRVGEKPLYVRRWRDTTAFSSELAPLVTIRGWPKPSLSPRAVHAYLTLSYVPGAATIYEGIHKLAPGSVLKITEAGAEETRYWERPTRCAEPHALDRRAAREELRAALARAVEGMLEADVPLGILLSGGLDSSIVLSLASRTGRSVRTFAVVFANGGGEFDERSHARRVARRFGAEHTEVEVHPAGSIGELPKLIRHFGQPFGLQAFLVAYLVSKAAREHVKVALTGVGGDELFGGYPRYQVFPMAAAWDLLPRRLRARAASAGPRLVGWVPHEVTRTRLQRFLQVSDQPVTERYLGTLRAHQDSVIRKLYTSDFQREVEGSTGLEEIRHETEAYRVRCGAGASPAEEALYADQGPWLTDCLLEYNDRMSMAVGLELRSPFLAREVLELAGRIPFAWKVGLLGKKKILAEAFRSELPLRNVMRRKAGFGAPTSTWLLKEWRPYMREVLSRERVGRISWLDFEKIDQLRRRFEGGDAALGRLVFSLLVLEEWHEQFAR